MRLSLFAMLLIFTVSFSGISAEEPLWNNEVRVGFGGTYKGNVNTNDQILGSKLKSKQGTYSLLLAYRYIKVGQLYGDIQLDFRGSQDSRTYDGSQMVTNGSNLFYQAALELGYPWMMSENWVGAPFIGIGSSSSKLNLSENAAVPAGDAYIVRKWAQGKLGYYAWGSIAPSWDMGFKACALYQINDPSVKTNLTADYNTGNQKVKLKKKLNFYVELPIAYALEGGQSYLELTPFYETQNMGKANQSLGSNTVNEKVYSTFLFGARFSYLYRF